MKIIEKIKWGKLRKIIWDEELEQVSGKLELNYGGDEKEFCFNPDRIAFDSEQLKKIVKILEKENNLLKNK